MGQRTDEHLMSPSPGKFMSTLFLTGPSCGSIVTASLHFAFFHLGRLLRQMET